MRRIAWILLVAGSLVIVSYMVADFVVKEAKGSSNPSVLHEMVKTLWSWGVSVCGALRDMFKALFIQASVPVAVKGAGAAVILAVLILIYTQMFEKSSGSSSRRSGRSRSRF